MIIKCDVFDGELKRFVYIVLYSTQGQEEQTAKSDGSNQDADEHFQLYFNDILMMFRRAIMTDDHFIIIYISIMS